MQTSYLPPAGAAAVGLQEAAVVGVGVPQVDHVAGPDVLVGGGGGLGEDPPAAGTRGRGPGPWTWRRCTWRRVRLVGGGVPVGVEVAAVPAVEVAQVDQIAAVPGWPAALPAGGQDLPGPGALRAGRCAGGRDARTWSPVRGCRRWCPDSRPASRCSRSAGGSGHRTSVRSPRSLPLGTGRRLANATPTPLVEAPSASSWRARETPRQGARRTPSDRGPGARRLTRARGLQGGAVRGRVRTCGVRRCLVHRRTRAGKHDAGPRDESRGPASHRILRVLRYCGVLRVPHGAADPRIRSPCHRPACHPERPQRPSPACRR